MQTVYLDSETTGLEPGHDEVLEIGIVDDEGQPLVSSLVKPERATEWPDAERINSISPAMVADAPTLAELMPAIRAATEGKRVVIYNAGFDVPFIPGLDEWAAEIRCAMLEYAEYAGEWNDYYGSYRWHKLTAAAQAVGFVWPGTAHRAETDALACRAVWRFLECPAERERVRLEKAREELEQTAERLLLIEQRNEVRRQERLARHMTDFLDTWWLGRYGAREHWAREHWGYQLENELALVFFDKRLDLLKLEDSGLPIYRKKSEIPDNLKAGGYFPRWAWFQSELKASAVYVGKNRGWELYPISEMERIKAMFPLRFAPTPPELLTATDLKKKHGLNKKQIEALEPVAERMNQHNFEWYKLYQPPEGDKEIEL